MSSQWSITITEKDGVFTFTPYVPGAHAGQPLGVNPGDLVTWNNQTNGPVQLQSLQPTGLFSSIGPIPAGSVSKPMFQFPTQNVTAVGYSRVPPGSRPPDHWIVVVPPPTPAVA